MARDWPAQLGGADSGGRAAAPTRESRTIRTHPSSGLESSVPRVDEPAATSRSYSDVVLVQEIITFCEHAHCESVLLACSAACREPFVYW
eukprot:scaffold144980_cov127-Phaeocystis_antarctica.AAC.1